MPCPAIGKGTGQIILLSTEAGDTEGNIARSLQRGLLEDPGRGGRQTMSGMNDMNQTMNDMSQTMNGTIDQVMIEIDQMDGIDQNMIGTKWTTIGGDQTIMIARN